MKRKRGILLGDDEILQYPDGTIELSVLESILEEATQRQVERSRLVIVINHERVANFNSDNPRYKNVKYRIALEDLFARYKSITGQEYRNLTSEEKEEAQNLKNYETIRRAKVY